MINTTTLGRLAAGAGLACAVPLAGCATTVVRSEERCSRYRIALEPRLTVSVGLDGRPKPIVALTTRPVCTHRERAS